MLPVGALIKRKMCCFVGYACVEDLPELRAFKILCFFSNHFEHVVSDWLATNGQIFNVNDLLAECVEINQW